MEIKSSLKYLRISPRKVRLTAGLIKGLPVVVAEANLRHAANRSAGAMLKLLKSAVANAENNFRLEKSNLLVKNARVDEGPAFKRWRPRARGSAAPIRKRTSHVYLTLQDKKDQKAPAAKETSPKSALKKSAPKKANGKKNAAAKRPRFQKEEKILKQSAKKQKVFRRKAI